MSSSVGSAGSGITIVDVSEQQLEGRDGRAVGDAPGPRRSARVAGSEPAEYVSMEAKAVKLRALRDALSGCSPRLKSKVLKDKMLDGVHKPMTAKAVAELRCAASIRAVPAADDANV